MHRDLSEYPDFGPEPIMPWNEPILPVWPFGRLAGTPLRDFSSATLLRKRQEVEKKNGQGSYFKPLLEAIDTILLERQGE